MSEVKKNIRQREKVPLSCLVNQTVNPPITATFIRFVSGNRSIITLDVSSNATNASYINTTLIFYLPNQVQWNSSDQFSIYFDEGVLYSNATVRSPARNTSDFWSITVVDSPSVVTTAVTTMMTQTTGFPTSMSGGTSGYPVTSMSFTEPTNQANTTMSTGATRIIGESSPTRSAQLGMGLGITFISLIVIGEIVYFKYCYSDHGRSGSYYT